jgi:hypothetical protein
MPKTKIYIVSNIYGDSNKVYIGKTKNNRKYNHIKTYGKNITYDYIDEINSLDRKDWEPLETKWIQYYVNLGYDVVNKRKKGGNGPEFHNKEIKEKISKILKGKKRSIEQKQTYIKSLVGRKFSSEQKKKISLSKIGKGGRKIVCINDNKIFNTITEASYFYNIKLRSITNILHGRANKTINNLTFKYI